MEAQQEPGPLGGPTKPSARHRAAFGARLGRRWGLSGERPRLFDTETNQLTRALPQSARAILVLESEFPAQLLPIKNMLGVEYFDAIKLGSQPVTKP